VGTKRREAAPNAEWVLMYRGGLTRGQIAKLVGAATSTVGYHLSHRQIHRSWPAVRA
jgi:hypothetical protein